MTAVVTPGQLNLSYPLGDHTSAFTFLVSTFAAKKDVSGWADVQGLTVEVTGNVDANYTLGIAGSYGGAYSTIK